jgi:serine protease Do
VITKRVPVPRWVVVLLLSLAVGAGAIGGSLAVTKQGRGIPILMAAQSTQPPPRVSFESGFAPVVKRVLPAVVNVSSSKMVRTSQNMSPFFSDPFFRQFFGNQFSVPREQREHSLGSGVIVSPDGYILTNNHVVNGATDVKVLLGDKREFKAKIVGTDSKTDIAVLKIDAQNLPVLAFGDSSKMEPGDFVLAIGNPFGLNQTVTMGIVSATGRGGLGIEDYEDFIQTDAAINPGNSGGALVNERGDLIGINTAILSGGGGNQGVGFAIPVNMARQVMDQILKNGKVIRAWLGVVIQPVTPDMAKAFGLAEAKGALIGDVTANSPAAKAGLEKGDIILDLNGQPIEDSRSLQLKVATLAPNTAAKLTVFRNGTKREVTVMLGVMPSGTGEGGGQSGQGGGALDGVSVDNLSPGILQQLGLPATTQGVVVSDVSQGSAAADAGLQRGDVIQQVNRKPVTNVSEFQSAVRQAGNRPVLLLVNRQGTTSYVLVQPE